MVYTTYLWWFGGWFIIVLPTLPSLPLWKSPYIGISEQSVPVLNSFSSPSEASVSLWSFLWLWNQWWGPTSSRPKTCLCCVPFWPQFITNCTGFEEWICIPDAPCMEYLPTKLGYVWGKCKYSSTMEHLGMVLYDWGESDVTAWESHIYNL